MSIVTYHELRALVAWTLGSSAVILGVVIAILFLTSCATMQTEQPTLRAIAVEDLDAAIAQAGAQGDKIGLQCWEAVKAGLPKLNQPAPSVKGIASAIQAKRMIRSRIDAGIPPEIVVGCSSLYVEEHFSVLQDLARFIGIVR